MPPEDFYECMLFDSIQPFSDLRGDIQAGIIASTIANFSGRTKKTTSATDFMPFRDGDAPETPKTDMQAAEELHAKFLAFKINRELKKQPS